MIQNISILGSTGSIGTQTLDVVDKLNLNVTALTANSNVKLTEQQIRKYKPQIAVLFDEEKAKEDLIYALENSSDFISTHTIVKKLSAYNEWSSEQIKLLFEIAVSNNQVLWILKDHDIKAFYLDLLQKVDTPDDNVKKVQGIFKLEDKA